MYRNLIRLFLGAALLPALVLSASAQPDKPAPDKPGKPREPRDYREDFLKPEKLPEFWEAMQFELEVGRPDLAAKYLNQMLNKQPPFEDKDWVALEQQVGQVAFLRLRLIQHWSNDLKIDNQARKDAADLTTRVNTALFNILGNPETIRRYIKQLNGDREDRNYATKQIQHAGQLAIPTLLAELHSAKGDDHEILMDLLPRLDPQTLLPMIAALDVDDTDLRLDIMEILMQPRGREAQPYLEKAIPSLWYLAGSRKVPDRVREKAKDVLARLTRIERAKLPAPAVALTREAERYYSHAVPLETPVTLWRWDEKLGQPVEGLSNTPVVSPSLAEEYYGLRAARRALEIDPTYAPAQQVLLGLLLEKAAERAGADQPLPRDLRELLATVNPDLINQLLEQALTDHRVSVALGAIRALGEAAETRALKPTGHGEPALVRALSYPDRRIQFAAADALLHIPAVPSPTATGRVVDVLRRYAAIDPQPKARRPLILLGFENAGGDAIARAAREASYDVERVDSGRAVLERLKKSADVDAVLIGTELPNPTLTSALAQLREDPGFAAVPLWLVTPWDTEESLKMRQYELDQKLRTFRLEKQRLQEERKRVEGLYLNAKGAAATPHKVRLDQIDKELLNFTLEKEDMILAERKSLDRQLLTAPPARDAGLRRLLTHYRRVWVLPESSASDPRFLKAALAQPLADVAGRPLTPAESKTYAEESLTLLAKMARGEITGYDFTPAEPCLYQALHAPGLSENALRAAIEATGQLPAGRGGDKPQMELASIVLAAGQPVPVRQTAAMELQRRIQRYSPVLSKTEAQKLEELRSAPGTDEKLREAVALVIGAMRPDARLTGERLQKFEPKPPAKLPPPNEEKPK